MESTSSSPVATPTRSRTIAGFVAAHLGLGFLWLVITLVAYLDKGFLLATGGGGGVGFVVALAFLAWVVAFVVVSILLAEGRRRWVWLVPVGWFAVSLTAVLVAIKLATPVYQGYWG